MILSYTQKRLMVSNATEGLVVSYGAECFMVTQNRNYTKTLCRVQCICNGTATFEKQFRTNSESLQN